MVDARFNPTIKYDYCDGVDHGNDDGVGHVDDDSDGDVQGSSSSSWTTGNAWNRNSDIFQGWR